MAAPVTPTNPTPVPVTVVSASNGTPLYQRMEFLFLVAALVVLIIIAVLTLNGDKVDSNWWTAAEAFGAASGVVYSSTTK